ncbi:Protein N-acetyltransferase, RimJ/RimL family [Actinokineospora alba]|uniref:Protein N-acetyltransferase, RimJ/RimL family n=1 Tax=Actinokineospora alba TaxID=504798 RepID=A0A1H0G5N0_9PSEU|nr:GNAT family protein [Actinokineospora alba]TDP69774.1 RimJ/RimL family protein N-acetyltransferase [Actinokineospora alba]SDI09048.1 Protein N-acetyltransferase, RimJ/RimL family [Actinokineospora alba]SDO02205.1 Protein N-acetyltransferase, RimJ/RimL family [Actinokineospora alba]
MNDWQHRPTLTGSYVHLAPLTERHCPGLFEAGKEPSIWTWLSTRQPQSLADTERMVAAALADPTRLPLVQLDAVTGEVAGTTSFYEIDERNRGLYIGHTWIGARWQRTALNTEAKLMLLRWAFDHLGALHVGWHTDLRNERSQRAIERLGATREGVLRAHKIRTDGTLRDTVVYSVTAEEWPAVRSGLEARLDDRAAR